MKRREFIQYSSASAGLLSLGKMPIALGNMRPVIDETDKILLIVQLFGGNDALNTIIPVEIDSYYTKFRPTLGIKKQDALKLNNTTLAMHPSLKSGVNDGLYGLYNAGKLAVIQGIGYENPNFSHFRNTDIWLSGLMPKPDSDLLETGWLGRYFDDYYGDTQPQSPYSIHVGNSPSLIFQGRTGTTAVLLENPDLFFDEGKNLSITQNTAATTTNYGNEYAFIQSVANQSNKYSKTIKDAFDAGSNQEQYTNKTLSSQLKLVARLISGGLKTKVYFVNINGFDTHSNQGVKDGVHAALLAELSEAISAFMSDLDKQKFSDKVVGITISEFGRRANENASFGTDHGAASVMFAFGNGVKPQIFGNSLLQAPITTDNNFIYQYDFRRVYYELLQTWLGTSPVGAKSILEGRFQVIEKGILKATKADELLPTTTFITDMYGINNDGKNAVFSPNPVSVEGTLSVLVPTNNATIKIEQFDVSGRNFGELFNGNVIKAGIYDIPLSINGDQGIYILRATVAGQVYHLKILKN